MIESEEPTNELSPPPIAETNPDAVEVLRVWATPGGTQELRLRTAWDEPGAWGILLADIARNVALAYAEEGKFDEPGAMRRIVTMFMGELAEPTERELVGDDDEEE